MKKSHLTWTILLAATMINFGCDRKVQTGKIVACQTCSREIINTVRTEKVSYFNAGPDRITREKGYCLKCGNEKVGYQVRYRCNRCGREYKTLAKTAPRRMEKKDEIHQDAFCSQACENWGKVEKGIDRLSEGFGDVAGRIGSGIIRGMEKHIR